MGGVTSVSVAQERELDGRLVDAIRDGDQAAFAEVYRAHGGAALGLARRVLPGGSLAEDVVQEVFLRLWRAPGRFDPERGSLRAFLLADVHGRSIDLLRSDRARRRREIHPGVELAPAPPDPQDEVAARSVAEHTRRRLSELPDERRRAIELAYFGGYSYREVAQLLGAPDGTVKSWIRAGLAQLRESYPRGER
jgi:RNA polymerase sigma-70 factor (ECF subfamily)